MANLLSRSILAILPVSLVAYGAEEPAQSSGRLEEVTVTAQIRSQSIQDVPISISAVSGEMIEERQLYNFQNLTADLPNVEFVSSPGLDKALGIRGLFTATANPGFEQSVGVFSDGVYISRGRLYNMVFLDVDRVEVLRGPQGVLNGKNAIAGAINIHSNKPTAEFEAGVVTNYEFENEGYSGMGYVSGPMTDKWSGRAVIQYQKIGGYLDFPRSGRKDQNESDYLSFRGSLLFEPAEDMSLLLRYDQQDIKLLGQSFGPLVFQAGVAEQLDATYRANDPDFDFVTNDVISSGRLLTVDDDGNVLVTNKRPEQKNDAYTLSSVFDWGFDDGGQFTSITGYLNYSSSGLYSQTMQPVDWLTQGDDDEEEGFDQFTQELRYVSPGGEKVDYLFGLYYLSSELKFGMDDAVVSSEALGAPAVWNFLPFDSFKQDTESLSIFGQLTWNITDAFRSSLGLRYTNERKSADGALEFLSTDRSMIVGGQPPGSPGFNPVADQFGVNWADSRKRENNNLDPSIVVQWDVSDAGMLYVSWTKATKAGGFNAADTTGANFEYEPEEASSFEVGAKLSLLDDSLRMDLAVFSTEYDDLQVSAFDANINAFLTNNAAKATVEGFEADLVYAMNTQWTVGTAVGYLDATYDNYPGAQCSVGESREANCLPDDTRNAKGDELRQAPDWTSNAYVDYVNDLSDRLSFGARLTLNYSDSYYMGVTNDPYMEVDSYTKTDALIWLGESDKGWKVSFLAKNLEDERVPYFANNTPLDDGAYWASVQSGREYYLEFSYRM